jgi:hypothetical protein
MPRSSQGGREPPPQAGVVWPRPHTVRASSRHICGASAADHFAARCLLARSQGARVGGTRGAQRRPSGRPRCSAAPSANVFSETRTQRAVCPLSIGEAVVSLFRPTAARAAIFSYVVGVILGDSVGCGRGPVLYPGSLTGAAPCGGGPYSCSGCVVWVTQEVVGRGGGGRPRSPTPLARLTGAGGAPIEFVVYPARDAASRTVHVHAKTD